MVGDGSKGLDGLPSIERLASSVPGPRDRAVRAAREVVAGLRARIDQVSPEDLATENVVALTKDRADALGRSSLRRVVNATGVVLHTNLGRAPLAPAAARAAAEVASGYSNLEYDLELGERGSREVHLEGLLREISGAGAAIAVNNNAAAVLLAVTATASGREVITGRDSLIEIGGSFRVPEILAQSGADLVEVGATNRTCRADYSAAISKETAALLRVHQSNFRTVGFTGSTSVEELCALGRERGLPVIDDLGSGALEPLGDEPLLRSSVRAGAALVCFSADKLLGGPQAGAIVGEAEAVGRCRKHPLARALRLDKMQIAALEATLRLHRDEGSESIPALAMLSADQDELALKASGMARAIGPSATVTESTSLPGGGCLPTTELPGPVCSVEPGELGAERLLAAMRDSDPPVIARVASGRVLLDPRTMDDAAAAAAADSVVVALAGE